MRFLLALSALLALCCGQTPNRAALLTKITTNMGVKFPSKTQLKDIFVCMETPLWKGYGVDDLMSEAMNCVMGPMMSSFDKLYKWCDNINACMDACPATASPMDVAMSLATSNMGEGLSYFAQMNSLLAKAKANKKTKAQGMENVYKWGAGLFNKSSVNTICTNLVKSGAFSNCQWQCVLKVGKNIVDFSLYKCSTLKAPSK